MSYYKMMKQVEQQIDTKGKQTKSADYVGSGLLARSEMPTGPLRAAGSVTEEIAEYIEAIRQQKEELIRGSK